MDQQIKAIHRMLLKNIADREILEYLQFLVDHSNGCKSRNCDLCASLQAVCEAVASRLFAIEFYPEVAKSANSRAFRQSGV